jgi:serine/threonine protein kinase
MTGALESPTAIGPFVVHRKLGEGAMGVVYAGYDVALDRKVAIKLVRPQLLGRAIVRERMVREAQAMARLSSPHVVQVYQAGEYGDGIYVAMEYVAGPSLADWLAGGRRPWQAALKVVCDAGRGLAAAHAAGLVHRDFKPDNVLVDELGRARVLDFGLVQSEVPFDGEPTVVEEPGRRARARARRTRPEEVDRTPQECDPRPPVDATLPADADAEAEAAARSADMIGSVRLTQAGRAVGTPAYMSPEQHFGGPVGPASDQFAFSIALYEALYGVRPFSGDSWAALKDQVRRGEVPPPPPESRVPARVFKILQRGLARDPERRWPSMDAMIAALEHDPRRARRRVARVAALLAVASAASYGLARSHSVAAERCAGAARELAGVWDAPRAAGVARAFAATRASFAEDAWRRVEPRLGAYADALAAEQLDACEAHAEGRQSDRVMDLRVACLGRHRARLAALLGVFAAADRDVVEHAVQAVAALPSARACGDVDGLLTAPPPDDPATAAEAERLRGRLAEVAALEATGRYGPGLERARQVREEAERLRWAPVEAEAALAEGGMLLAAARHAEAEPALARALHLAVLHRLDAAAAEAAARQIYVVGSGLERPSEALALRGFAEAMALRARDDRITGLLHNNLGTAYYLQGDREAARARFVASLELLRAAPGAGDPLIAVILHNLGEMAAADGQAAAAREHYRQAVALGAELLGERHPFVAHPLGGLADLDREAGDAAAATRGYARALELMEAAYGPAHMYEMLPLTGLGELHARAGEAAAARARFERVVAIADAQALTHPLLARALAGLGALTAAADPARARRLLARAVEVFDATTGPDSGLQAEAALRAGELAAAQGDVAEATRWFERVLALPPSAATGAAAWGLAGAPGEDPRTCALLATARASLPADDPRRAEAGRRAAGCDDASEAPRDGRGP